MAKARSSYSFTDSEILNRIGRSPGGKAGYKQLIRELGLGGGRERRLLVEQLTRMVARGELAMLEDGLWAIPKRKDSVQSSGRTRGAIRNDVSGRERLKSGRLDMHRDGYGFVRLDAQDAGNDIFIPAHEINGAMQGDVVLVEEVSAGRDGKKAGRIARVLTRRNPTVVGIFHYAGGLPRQNSDSSGYGPRGNYVSPVDERIGSMIEIPDGAEIVADRPESPHRVLGEEAREQQRRWEPKDPLRPLEGLAVDVEITSFPQPGRPARGRILEVLGPPDAFGVDVEIVIRKHHIPHAFPTAVLADAAARAEISPASLPADEVALREDFRGLPIVTIDGETARDFDDAVLVRPLQNGNTELQVHIADVSAYVLPGSPLDTEARVRGNSVYFPDRAVPMLPHLLSSGMCSLRPDEDRLVLSCVMEVDDAGEIVDYRLTEGMIRSVKRMTYTSVQACLNASPAAARWNDEKQVTTAPAAEDFAERERLALEQPELAPAFDRMLELALKLNAKRVRRGSIDFDLPEPVVEFDPDGNMKSIVRSERGWAHRLIEEFMLSANECVAAWIEQQGVPSIYRIHETPDPKRIVEFEEAASSFGHSLGLGSLPVRRVTMKADRRQARQNSSRGRSTRAAQVHEIPESIPVTPQMYQRLVRKITGRPEERILAYLMLRSLKQARYSEKNEGHFALASPSYTHFTSPIRRYPDLIVHRLVRALLRAGRVPRSIAREQHVATKSFTVATKTQRGGHKREGRVGWTEDAAEATALHRASDKAQELFAAPRSGADAKIEARSIQPVYTAGMSGLISEEGLKDIAVESSQTERRAADAERELIEWKKIKFMADKVGDDFSGIILSVTKYGFFVELDDLFIEGLVPIASLAGDHYAFRDTDRTICGARTGHCFSLGQRVQVILDRIDRQQRRLQFALLPGTEPVANTGAGHTSVKAAKAEAKKSKRSSKALKREKKAKRKGH